MVTLGDKLYITRSYWVNSFCQGAFSLCRELSAGGTGCSGTNLPVSLKLVEKSLDQLL